MADPSRSGSLPLLNDSEDLPNLINPAYSGSVTASARYSSRQDVVEMEVEFDKPAETASMKRIKYAIVLLFILIGTLIIINISHLAISISERTSVVENEATAVTDLEAIIDIAALSFHENVTETVTSTEISSSTESASSSSTSTTSSPESTTTSATQPPQIASFGYPQQYIDVYRNFTERFNRTFSAKGLDNYVSNMRFFSTGSVTFGETQFADLSEGQLRKQENYIDGATLYDNHDKIPSRADLRRNGNIRAVRNQGTSCNAGYAFAVTSLLESKVDTNGERLSVQMLLADDSNHHCEGGETFRAMKAAEENGMVLENVLPFDESQQWHNVVGNVTRYKYEQPCLLLGSHMAEDSYYNIVETTIPASTYIKQFLAKVGAVIVEVPVNRSFFFYKSGLYTPDCTNGTILGYQPTVAVGYGMRNGDEIWILRNSFGIEWGIDGDFEMRSISLCGTFDYAFTFYKAI